MNRKQIANLLKFIITLLFITLIAAIVYVFYINKTTGNTNIINISNKSQNQNIVASTPINPENMKTVKEVVESYNCKFIEENNRKIYLTLGKDLYDENGNSNEDYFTNLTNDLIKFYTPERFYLVDDSRNVTIMMEFNRETEEYIMRINNITDYFEYSNGESYSEVDNAEIVEGHSLFVDNVYLDTLSLYGLSIDNIADKLGEGKDLGTGYTSYQNNTIRIRSLASKSVKNIIFCNNYEGNITRDIKFGMKLKDILELEPEVSFGSLNDGFLGYRDKRFYLFFYKDEVSIYTYAYQKNKEFEKILDDYITSKDLDRFINKIKEYGFYDSLEYDADKKNAKVLLCSKGIEINIENNDSRGITLYSNYYFTDSTRQYVKNGLIKYNGKEDLIYKTEQERRAKY